MAGTENGKPTLAQVAAWAIADKDYWRSRNERFERHQKLFDLEEPSVPEGQVAVVLNDPHTVIEKAASIVGRKTARIEVWPKGEANAGAAQRIENALRWYEKEANERRRDGIHNAFDYDINKSAALRGWIADLLMIDREGPMCVRERLQEPYHLYPRIGGDRIVRVIHEYETTAADVKTDFPDANELRDYPDDQLVTVVAVYVNEPPYWHCVTVDAKWAKPPVEPLGHWPWVIRVVKGAFTHDSIGGSSRQDAARDVGQGFLDGIEGIVKRLNQFITMLANATARMDDPPTVLKLVGNKLKEISMLPGSRNVVGVTEGVQLLEPGPGIAQMMNLSGTFQDRFSKSTFPSAMFGAGAEVASGYLQALMMNAANDVLWTMVDTAASFKMRRFQKVLEIFRDNYPDTEAEVGYDFPMRATRMGNRKSGLLKGQHVWGTKLTVEDVKKNGIHVNVSYPDVTPQDRLAIANMVLGLVREKVWSLKRGRDMTEVDDPNAEEEQVLREQMFLNEEVIKEAAYASWREAAQELPTTQAIIKVIHEERAREAAAKAAAANPMAQQPPGLPQAGGNLPVDMNGQPAMALPPESAGQGEPGGLGGMDIMKRLATMGLVGPGGY